MENELYEFAVEQFNFLKRRMIVNKDGQLLDKGQQFMYEKISPKWHQIPSIISFKFKSRQ